MPSIIVQDGDGDSRVLPSRPFAYEEILQRKIAELPGLLPLETVSDEPVSHLTIGKEWPAGTGKADIVLIGSDAVLTIVETKLSRNSEARREVVAQLLEYAAYLSEWTIYEIQRRTEDFFRSGDCLPEHTNKSFDEVLETFLEDSEESVDSLKASIERNLKQGRIRLIVAVDEISEQAQKIVTFVNSYSSFDIYLLQVSEFEDNDGRRTLVPSLYGYARKVSTTRSARQWDWEQYESELGWSKDQVSDAQRFLEKLQMVAKEWDPEPRLHQGWLGLRCLGREKFGIQVFKKRGLELWFQLDEYTDEALPPGVIPRQTKEYLYLGGSLRNLSDDQLHRLCEAALKRAGLLATH
jgi:hypothetical protein